MKKEYIVEILILLFLALCIALISFWAYKVFFAEKNTHILYFRDVDGIVVGSPVRFMGVVVGHVNNLEYKDGIINVKILITKKGINFPKGSTASVQFTGLAGSKSVEIIPPSDDSSFSSVIVTENPVRIKDLFEFGKSYTNTLLSVENQIELISAKSLYRIIEAASIPYDWTNIDNMLDSRSHRAQNFYHKVDKFVNKQKQVTDQVEKLNQGMPKNHF